MHKKSRLLFLPIFLLVFLPSIQPLIDQATSQNGLDRILRSLHKTGDALLLENIDLPDVTGDINHIITTIMRVERTLNNSRKIALDTKKTLDPTTALLQIRFSQFYLNTIINSCLDDVILSAQKEKLPETFIDTLIALINYESCYVYANKQNQPLGHKPFLYPFALFFLQVLNYVLEEAPSTDTLEGYLENLHHRMTLIIGRESQHEEYKSPLGNTHITSIKKLLELYIAPLKREDAKSITESTADAIGSIANFSQKDLQKTLGSSYDTLVEKEPGVHRLVSYSSNTAAVIIPASMAAGGTFIIAGSIWGVCKIVSSARN